MNAVRETITEQRENKAASPAGDRASGHQYPRMAATWRDAMPPMKSLIR